MSAWRVSLEARGLGSSSIIIRMSAIRKLAAESGTLAIAETTEGARSGPRMVAVPIVRVSARVPAFADLSQTPGGARTFSALSLGHAALRLREFTELQRPRQANLRATLKL